MYVMEAPGRLVERRDEREARGSGYLPGESRPSRHGAERAVLGAILIFTILRMQRRWGREHHQKASRARLYDARGYLLNAPSVFEPGRNLRMLME